MRHMQIVVAPDFATAERSYREALGRRGVALVPSTEIHVQTVQRAPRSQGAWLCYVGKTVKRAA